MRHTPDRTAGAITVEKIGLRFAGKLLPAMVRARESMAPGKRFTGPAVVTEYSATTVVPPGARLLPRQSRKLDHRSGAAKGKGAPKSALDKAGLR